MEEKTNVRVLERALTILDLLRDDMTPLGVNEIAKRCGISSASCGPRLAEQYRLDDASFDFSIRLIPEKA